MLMPELTIVIILFFAKIRFLGAAAFHEWEGLPTGRVLLFLGCEKIFVCSEISILQ
jgi:hypothetical protein